MNKIAQQLGYDAARDYQLKQAGLKIRNPFKKRKAPTPDKPTKPSDTSNYSKSDYEDDLWNQGHTTDAAYADQLATRKKNVR